MRKIFAFIAISFFACCSVDPQLPDNSKIPDYVPAPVYDFRENPWTEAGFQLGRALFYENMLSLDNSISCASCHQQFAAFANADHKMSHGVNDLQGPRNSPALYNLAWHPYFMHDGGINHIEVQPLGPITNPIEMKESIQGVLNKLIASARYKTLFQNAFGSDKIDSQRMLKALAQFMGKMNSFDSKYDQVRQHKKGVEYTASELRGYQIFQQKCNSCHAEPLFSDFVLRSNGLSIDPNLQDSGRAHVTKMQEDLYKFKTPSLRNLSVSGPYMHDGRFETLEECLNHYANGNFQTVNLDTRLPQSGIPLTDSEKDDIIDFLSTLTDYTYLKNKTFSDPKFK